MIYGINFNGEPIPDGYLKRFADRIRLVASNPLQLLEFSRVYAGPCTHYARLIGVATDRDSCTAMIGQAMNGHRILHVETRQTAGSDVYGIYEVWSKS